MHISDHIGADSGETRYNFSDGDVFKTFANNFPMMVCVEGNVTKGKIYVERIKGGRERRISSGEKGVLERRREGCIKEGFLEGQTQSSSHRLCTSEFLTHDSDQ